MSGVRGYLISIISACMICVIAQQMVQKESMKKIVRFISGILVLLVVTTPLLSLNGKELMTLLVEAGSQLEADTGMIEESAQTALEEHVRSTTENYIEKKAREVGATVQAKVTVTQEEYPVPYSARITGSLSSTQQILLSTYMSRDLGIDTSRQEWELYG